MTISSIPKKKKTKSINKIFKNNKLYEIAMQDILACQMHRNMLPYAISYSSNFYYKDLKTKKISSAQKNKKENKLIC